MTHSEIKDQIPHLLRQKGEKHMKNTQKLAGILLVLVMVLAMVVPTLAATGSSAEVGTITINDPVVGQTYTIYQMFGLESFNDDAANPAYSYTIDEDSLWRDFLNAPNYGSTIFKIVEHNNEYDYVTLADGVKINNDSEAAEKLAKEALAYAETKGIDGTPENFTEGDTELKFENLPLGYYLVDSSLGALCGLTTTHKDATVNEKNEGPTIDKFVQEDSKASDTNGGWYKTNTAEIGQLVNFKTVVTAKKGAQNYVIHDVMEAGWDFDSSSVEVKVGAATEALPAKSVTVTEEYSETNLSGYAYELKTTGLETTDPCTFHIEFVQAYLDKLVKENINDTTTSFSITVTYSATLNAQAEIATATNDNTTWLTYGENNKTELAVTRTSTFEFDLVKTDSSNKLLNGAEFKLYDQETGGNEIKLVKDGDVYRPVVTENEKAADGAVIVVSGGKVTIQGLDSDTYYLEETKQPDGYNKLASRVEVKIETGNLKTDMTDDTWNEGDGGVHVVNLTGAELPSTGGIGTTIFYIVGGILLVGAGVLLVVRKRMSTTKKSDK